MSVGVGVGSWVRMIEVVEVGVGSVGVAEGLGEVVRVGVLEVDVWVGVKLGVRVRAVV